jgi:hypothetical protein
MKPGLPESHQKASSDPHIGDILGPAIRKISNMLKAQKIMGTVFWDLKGVIGVRFLLCHTVKH